LNLGRRSAVQKVDDVANEINQNRHDTLVTRDSGRHLIVIEPPEQNKQTETID
jgi:hypothetical protein